MQESLYVTGIVLKQTPFGEYDRRVCLLTREKGKITAFARGPESPATGWLQRPTLCFWLFRLYEGRNILYHIRSGDPELFFRNL